ncbi:MAG: hypothetical protein PHT40_04620 [Patescibacteria group bacterium]|nr:hypothetical protein [Patescibacteria group bacterium]
MKCIYLLDPARREKPGEKMAKELLTKGAFDLVIDFNNPYPKKIFITFFTLDPEIKNIIKKSAKLRGVNFNVAGSEKIAGETFFQISCDNLPSNVYLAHFLSPFKLAGWKIEP